MAMVIKAATGFLLLVAAFFQPAIGQAAVPAMLKAGMGILKGELQVEGRPLPNAVISFFNTQEGPPPDTGTARRVPDRVERTDPDGKFSVELLPGSYFVGALIRDADKGPGPPRPGEKFFFARDGQGNLRTFDLKAGQTTEAGPITGIAPAGFKEFNNYMTIRGTVREVDGKPLAGVIVTLNDNMNSARPRFISGKTSADGTYEVKVPPGKYYVVAHESIRGGRPTPGSKIGMYGRSGQPGTTPSPNSPGGGPGAMLAPGSAAQSGAGNEALPVTGRNGDILERIDITMISVPDPEQVRNKFLEEAETRKKAADVPGPLRPEQK